jgi:hypothetical protein
VRRCIHQVPSSFERASGGPAEGFGFDKRGVYGAEQGDITKDNQNLLNFLRGKFYFPLKFLVFIRKEKL